ncbi:MAG: hypothetical protein IIC80_02465 [Chloroflexi bacterium]|nr:hypothetical protein [Chloroflexota bacterium]
MLSGDAETDTGEWLEHEVTVVDSNWEITHDEGFITVEDQIAVRRELTVSEVAEEGIIDPEPFARRYSVIMLYGP